MESVETSLADMSPAELERQAQKHVDGLFAALEGMQTHVRENYSPARLAMRHPVITAGVAAAAGLLVARMFRRDVRGGAPGATAAPRESVGKAFVRSLLSGMAGAVGNALPELILTAMAKGRAGERQS